MTDAVYRQKLDQEADLWGAEAERQAASVPPDWRYHRRLLHNAVLFTADIDSLLNCIRPAMAALELGCGPGWLTLAMAQRGAAATGIDISERALDVARAYYESIRAEVSGSAAYRAADLNTLELPADSYDVIAVKGALHHVERPDHLIAQIERALRPGGLLWVCDSAGDEALSTVLVSGALCFLLPTHTPYRDKLRALLRFGLRAPSRVKASIEAEGLSPFEGAGRERDWLNLVEQHFAVERRVKAPAFTGYVTHQIRLPDRLALPLLKAMRVVDRLLVRLRLLHPTGVTIYARKRPAA